MALAGSMTAIEIVSAALSELGAQPISGFDDSFANSAGTEALYNNVRDAIMSSYPWRCALRMVTLSPASGDANKNYSARYNRAFMLPTDLLRPYGLRSCAPHDAVGGQLYCNEVAPQLVYNAQVSESYMPAYLVSAIRFEMMCRLCRIATGKASTQSENERAAQELSKARVADSKSSTSEDISVIVDKILSNAPGRRP